MAYRLCNPTPFEAKIEWSPGVPIIVPADGEVELTHEQGQDFRLDQPGSENVLSVTQPMGIFLLDDNRNYDVQALTALRKAADIKKREYRRRVDALRRLRNREGDKPDEETMAQIVEDTGLNKIIEEAETLDKRAKIIAGELGEVEETVRTDFDPERTCFSLDTGPKEFKSKLALKVFLDENPDIKAREMAFLGKEEDDDLAEDQ